MTSEIKLITPSPQDFSKIWEYMDKNFFPDEPFLRQVLTYQVKMYNTQFNPNEQIQGSSQK